MTNMIFEFECEECGHEFEELVASARARRRGES
jgi:hypothetical protein